MSRIVIKVDAVRNLNGGLNREQARLNEAKDQLSSLIHNIDSRILSRRDISSRLNNAVSDLNSLEMQIRRLDSFVDFAMDGYCAADNCVNNKAVNLFGTQKKTFLEGTIFDDLSKIRKFVSTGLSSKKLYNILLAYNKYDFNINIKDINTGIVTITGARTPLVKSLGVNGTKYSFKNASKYPEVFKYIKPSVAVKSSLNIKTLSGKLQYAGIVLETASDLEKDWNKGPSKIMADTITDVGFGFGGIAASAAAGAAIGSIIPGAGTAVGAIVGFGAGFIYSALTKYKVRYWGNKSIKDISKDKLEQFFDWATK